MEHLAQQLVVVAEAAGELLKKLQSGDLDPRYKAPADLVTAADRESHDFISAELKKRFPHQVLILEEQENPASLPGDYLVGDELDGTAIYANGLSEWGVSLAYVEGGRPVVGILHQPRRSITIVAWRGGGTWIGGRRIAFNSTRALNESIILVELNRFLTEDQVSWISQIAGRATATRCLSSVVGSSVELLSGHSSLYVNLWGAKVWDFAAAVVAVEEAGGVALTGDGGALTWERIPMSVLLAINPGVANEALALSSSRRESTHP